MSTALPIYPVKNADGTFFTGGANPARSLGLLDWKTGNDRLLAGITMELIPVKNLSIKGTANMDNLNVQDNIFTPAVLRGTTNSNAELYRTKIFNRNFSGTATYDWQLDSKNKLKFLLGAESQI